MLGGLLFYYYLECLLFVPESSAKLCDYGKIFSGSS